MEPSRGDGGHWLRLSAEGAWCPVWSWGPSGKGSRKEGGHTREGGLSRSERGDPHRNGGTPPRKGMGSAGLDKGSPPKSTPGHGRDPPGKGAQVVWNWGDPHGQERGNLGGSEGQDMGVLTPHPKNGGLAWEDMGQHPEKGRPRGLSWAGCEGPSRTQRDPQENGGRAQLAWTLGDTLGGKRGAGEFSRSDHGGAHLSRTWRDISGWKGGLSWAGHGDPL